MTTYLQYLKRELDLHNPGWEENTVILLDNAKWHSNLEMKERLARMELPVIYSAPYCYSTAPVEMAFSALKLGDLNPEKLPTGKKSLTHVTDLVARRLSQIPKETVIRYWHHIVSNHFGYLYFERL